MISQAEVESEIMRLCALAEKVTHELASRAVTLAEADATFKREHAKAFLVAEGTVSEREAHAAIATQAEYRDHRIAEARFKAASEAGRNFRTQIEALRSINSNLRALVSQ
jgi:AmiR/NasT family two-component response regulator